MRKVVLMFFFTLIFFSCEKYEQLIIDNPDIPLISKVLIGGEVYKEYTYNDANLVKEEKSKFHYSRHKYNIKNQLITSDFYWDLRAASSDSRVLEDAMNRKEWVNPDNTPKSISHYYEYSGEEQLVSKAYVRPQQSYSDIVEFLYEDERVIRATGYKEDEISGYTDYSYDSNGNISKQERYHFSPEGIAELTTTTEYEYDNMNNPYQSFKRLITPGIYTNQNNIVKETYTIHFEVDAFIEKVQIKENSYEYNDKGYPVKVNEVTEYVYR
jgi:hypothetical protein